jgi:hypothetical protein
LGASDPISPLPDFLKQLRVPIKQREQLHYRNRRSAFPVSYREKALTPPPKISPACR